jgi:uncharacterized protein (DUF697 family)
MNKKLLSQGLSKLIPIAGSIIGGWITLHLFLSMAFRLNKELQKISASGEKDNILYFNQ